MEGREEGESYDPDSLGYRVQLVVLVGSPRRTVALKRNSI